MEQSLYDQIEAPQPTPAVAADTTADSESSLQRASVKRRGPSNYTHYIKSCKYRANRASSAVLAIGNLTEKLAAQGCVGVCITKTANGTVRICPTHNEIVPIVVSRWPGIASMIAAMDADQRSMIPALREAGAGTFTPLPKPPRGLARAHSLLWKVDRNVCKLANTTGVVSTYIFITPFDDNVVTRSTGDALSDFMKDQEKYSHVLIELRRIMRDQRAASN
jgi:hypothetical protein